MELPLAIYITSDQGNIEVHQELYEECKPRNMIQDLDLLHKNYEKSARYGQFLDAEDA